MSVKIQIAADEKSSNADVAAMQVQLSIEHAVEEMHRYQPTCPDSIKYEGLVNITYVEKVRGRNIETPEMC